MARLRTVGFEMSGIASGAGVLEGNIQNPTFCTIDTSTKRTGARSLKIDSSASNFLLYTKITLASSEKVAGRGYRSRVYIRIPAYPATDSGISALVDTADAGFYIKLKSDGKLQLWAGPIGSLVQIGSDSTNSISLDTWHRIELYGLLNSGASDDFCEARLDGPAFAIGSNLTVSTLPVDSIRLGWSLTAPGANSVIYYDDLAFNDDQGSDQNSWPGEGRLVAGRPISDNAVGTGWLDGDGAGTLFGSLDNSPPAGAATPADGTQIKHLTSNTSDYDANMTTYANLGITGAHQITVVQAVVDHGEDVSTNTKNGALKIVSNPTQSGEDGFIYGFDAGADGAWPTNWGATWGTAQYKPSVALATSPVVRIGRRTASTREIHADALALYVEYVDAMVRKPTVITPRFESALYE